jgi:hypothetical protein
MANYIKSTDFAIKDGLTTGDPNKIIKGTEINTELNDISTAIASKADTNSPVFTGNPTAPTQAFGNNSTRLATTAFVQFALQALYPIGTIYTAVVATNPASLFGFGTWVAFGAGRVLVGYDSGNTLFDAAEETGGSYNAALVSHTHTATVTDAGHTHNYTSPIVGDTPTQGGGLGPAVREPTTNGGTTQSSTTGITVANSTEGVSATNANIQPYITVYMWKRTA